MREEITALLCFFLLAGCIVPSAENKLVSISKIAPIGTQSMMYIDAKKIATNPLVKDALNLSADVLPLLKDAGSLARFDTGGGETITVVETGKPQELASNISSPLKSVIDGSRVYIGSEDGLDIVEAVRKGGKTSAEDDFKEILSALPNGDIMVANAELAMSATINGENSEIATAMKTGSQEEAKALAEQQKKRLSEKENLTLISAETSGNCAILKIRMKTKDLVL